MSYNQTGTRRSFSPSGEDRIFLSPGRPPRRFRVLLLVLLASVLLPLAAWAQRGVSISYLPDPGASLTVEEAAGPGKAADYRGYVPSFMAFSRLPDSFNGAIWLRFAFDPAFEKPVNALRIDLGTLLPGTARLFIPRRDGTFSVMESSPPQGVFTLPDTMPFPDILYARIDGTPGLWFRPVLGQAGDGGLSLPFLFALAGFFGLAMLFSLVQYVRGAEEWRLWAAITAGCGIVGAILPASPAAGAAGAPLMVAGMLTPGLIFLFFVHTVRHLFATPKTMPGYDKFLVLLYLAAAVIALLPLVPGFLWAARYLPFTGMASLLLLPVGMTAMARSLRGGSFFFLAVLLPVAGVAASAWELTAPDVPLLAGTGGLWGLALALLLLAFIPPARPKPEAVSEEDVFDSLNRSAGPQPGGELAVADFRQAEAPCDEPPPAEPSPAAGSETPEPGGLESPAAFPEPESRDDFPDLSLFGGSSGEDAPAPSPADGPGLPIPDEALKPLSRLPEARGDGVAASGAGLGTGKADTAAGEPQAAGLPEPPAAGEETPRPLPVISLADTAGDTAGEAAILPAGTGTAEKTALETAPAVLSGITVEAAPAGEIAEAPPALERRKGRRILFNLPMLVKNVYDTLAPLAEAKNLGLTWFIAPQTGRLFEGEAELLESALSLVLRDMVEAADQGNVRLNIRRLPDSAEPGHLVFTIVAWDGRQTEHDRKIAGLAEAWALAEKTGGIFSVEHSPASGTTVIFSSVFTAMEKPKASEPETAPAPEEAPGRRPVAELPAKGATDAGVQVFTDYPDIAIPEDDGLSISVVPVPPGIDADDLGERRETERDPLRIIVTDIAASSRAKTAGVLAGTAYSVLECASPQDARALYTRHPSALLIMNADMPEVDIVDAIGDIHADDEANGRSPACFIALVGYAAQAERMVRAGATRTVLKSALEEELLPAVEAILPPPSRPGDARETGEAPALETLIDKALENLPSIEPSDAPPSSPDAGELPPENVAASGIFVSVLPDPETGASQPAETEPAQAAGSARPAGSAMPEYAVKPASGRGLGLLDMIITDEEEADDDVLQPKGMPAGTPELPRPEVSGPPPSVARVSVKASAKPRKPVRVAVKSVKSTPASLPRPENPAPASGPAQTAGPRTAMSAEAPAIQPPETAATPPAATGSSPGGNAGDMRAPDTRDAPAAAISIPVPGEDDSVFKDMLPLIPGLLAELSDALADAVRGREGKSPLLVQEASERIAGKAEHFGLTRLERMARCVERAAAADDIEPMECVLADLEAWVTRYKDALQKLHRETML